MNGRILKILISVLCGIFLLIAGCATTAPSGGATPTQTMPTGQVSAVSPDLATVISLLQTTNSQLSLIAENTHPPGKDIVAGNIVLFDNGGNRANTITDGTSVVALPQGDCDIAVFANSVQMFTTVEELKDYVSSKYSRNSQSCIDTYLCRKSVNLDNAYSYLYIEYKPYKSVDSFDRVTLTFRCQPL